MSDLFSSLFPDADSYYPGSKRKRRVVEEKKPKDTGWETDFYKKTLPNGTELQMYTLGSLAKALGRPTKTVRFWVESGQLPTSPYRLPSKVGSNGKEYAGRRLYSLAMVESAVALFNKHGLLGVDRIEWNSHRSLVDEIAESWTKIREEETKSNN